MENTKHRDHTDITDVFYLSVMAKKSNFCKKNGKLCNIYLQFSAIFPFFCLISQVLIKKVQFRENLRFSVIAEISTPCLPLHYTIICCYL